MRIVLLDKEERLKVSGAAVFNERLYEHLVGAGHDVTILRFARKPQKKSHIYEIPYYIAESRSYIFVPSEKTLSIITNRLKKLKPDIVYSWAGLTPLDFFLPSLCHKLGIPLAAVWHMDLNYNQTSYKLLLTTAFLTYLPFCRQLDMVHVFSERLKRFFTSHGVDPKRVWVFPNGVDTSFYTPGPSQFAKTHGIRTGILFLGRLTFQKNPEVLIRSFLATNPTGDTKLVLAGFGELERPLKRKYRDPRIIFAGLIQDEAYKRDIMRGCQIFVLPSRFEGMSLALLEAMSCGMACIASNAGSNAEVLKDAGIIIPMGKMATSLPAALLKLMHNPLLVQELGASARLKAKKNHNQQEIFERITHALDYTVAQYASRGVSKESPPTLDEVFLKNLSLIWKKAKKLRIDFDADLFTF